MKSNVRKFVSRLAAPVMRRAASSYVAGPELDDAFRVALRLQGLGYLVTVGYWNGDEDSPRHVADAYLQSLAGMQGRNFDHLSIKLPALDYSCDLLEEVICAAKKLGVGLHFDSLGPETVDRTLSVLDRARSIYSDFGITIPTRWKRSLKDIDWAIERNVRMRIVKGQWPESASANPEQDFLPVIRHLAGRVARGQRGYPQSEAGWRITGMPERRRHLRQRGIALWASHAAASECRPAIGCAGTVLCPFRPCMAPILFVPGAQEPTDSLPHIERLAFHRA